MNAYDLKVEIIDIIQRTDNVKSFRLNVGEKTNYQAGQYLIVNLQDNKDLSRPLSISSSPTEKGYIEFTKKITKSQFSEVLDKLQTGDFVRVRYPFGSFVFNESYKKIAFLSGGIGVTPIKSMCKYVVDSRIETDLILIYGNRSFKDIVFKEDFDLMAKQFPKLKVVHVLCEADPACNARIGYINETIIKEDIQDYIDRKYFLCGPPAMVEAMKKILVNEVSIPKENIITENFAGY